MALPKNRYACMSDLKGYFRKLDLLSGLTEFEKLELRQNIGVMDYIGEGGRTVPIPITYSALLEIVERNEVLVGARYIITNYQTIYDSNVIVGGKKVSWGHNLSSNISPIYQLIVVGINTNKLDSKAYIIGKNWEINYDISREVLEDGTPTKGKITWMKDDNGNSAFYDFKNIKFRRTREQLRNTTVAITSPHLDLYTFSLLKNNNVVEDNSENELCEYNVFKENCWDNVFIGNTQNNIFEAEFKRNTFIKGCYDSHFLWNTYNNLFHERVAYTTGSIYNHTSPIGNTNFSTTITKTIHKVNDATILSYLDPITYSHQVVILNN